MCRQHLASLRGRLSLSTISDKQAADRLMASLSVFWRQAKAFSSAAPVGALVVAQPTVASAAAVDPSAIDGATLSLAWALPFAGLILSIALMPLVVPRFWHSHFGKVSGLWAAAFLVPFAAWFGVEAAVHEALDTLLGEYIPFFLVLFALFVVSGGIRVSGALLGTPAINTLILALGTAIASLLGTTGAAMLLIRPLVRANEKRRYNAHVFVFFIFLVCNIGGALTPLGDPPLFLGFLRGVPFGWTFGALLGPMVLCSGILLVLFYLLDYRAWRRDPLRFKAITTLPKIKLDGSHNFFLLAGVIGAVLLSGLWQPAPSIQVLHVALPLNGLTRDLMLIILAWLSWFSTAKPIRIENAFTWEPIQEIALLFAGIFITAVPALAILDAGRRGALHGLLALVTHSDGTPRDAAYFWLTGILSSFLDNAPTYLAFFHLAGEDGAHLVVALPRTVLAISAGAVFFGAMTYIGNAPNFMVKSICEERGIRMPTFFGYLLWSSTILLPLFVLVTVIWL